MGMYVGLESEEYDREYKDRVLLKRIFHYFGPYKRSMLIVILFLTISSLTYAFVPVLASTAINNLETSRNVAYLVFLLIIILILNLLSWVFNYFTVIYAVHVIGNVVLDLRRDAGQAILNHDLSFFDHNHYVEPEKIVMVDFTPSGWELWDPDSINLTEDSPFIMEAEGVPYDETSLPTFLHRVFLRIMFCF